MSASLTPKIQNRFAETGGIRSRSYTPKYKQYLHTIADPHNREEQGDTDRGRMPKRQTNLGLTVRRKFLLLVTRGQLRPREAHFPMGSVVWMRKMFDHISPLDNDVSYKDIQRWCRAHDWITDRTLHPPGMRNYWNIREDKVTFAGTLSLSYPKPQLRTKQFTGSNFVAREVNQSPPDLPAVPATSAAQNVQNENSARELVPAISGPIIVPTVPGFSGAGALAIPPALGVTPLAHYVVDAGRPVAFSNFSVSMDIPADPNFVPEEELYMDTSMEVGVNMPPNPDGPATTNADAGLGAETPDNEPEVTPPTSANTSANSFLPTDIVSTELSNVGEFPEPLPSQADTLDRFEEIYEALEWMTDLCQQYDTLAPVADKIKHMYKTVERNHKRHVVPMTHDEAMLLNIKPEVEEEGQQTSVKVQGTHGGFSGGHVIQPNAPMSTADPAEGVELINLLTP